MNAEQLQKTLRASQYAEQVLSIHQVYLEQDYAIDQFSQPLTTEQIFDVVQNTLKDISDEITWMRTIRILRARLMFRWIWQDANQLIDVMTLTRELSDFADAAGHHREREHAAGEVLRRSQNTGGGVAFGNQRVLG